MSYRLRILPWAEADKSHFLRSLFLAALRAGSFVR